MWYEHKQRLELSGASAAMVGRGALIKPWIFQEVAQGAGWEPTAEERVEVYLRLAAYFKVSAKPITLAMSSSPRFEPSLLR
jgi:tRNA-dihydrouridine synthase 3